ncbi:MAG: hypothetical protein P4L56_11105 [Candidatus Sulfopaludibacter sp.]|nr:hypothetical protein [Candidatus Sulfopaludibacter sp.]
MQKINRFAYWGTIGTAILAVGSYYLSQLQATGERFDWMGPQTGYYNYLGQALAHGRLALPVRPSPQLLAASNPWDPALSDSYKVHDLVYFHGRYYLYHGAGPAVLLFTPWLLLTGHDMPERFAMFVLCFGGFLFSCGVLLRWLEMAGAKPGLALLAPMLLALGLCSGVPYLLNRVAVYEIAIGGGYFFVSGGLFFLTLGVEAKTRARGIAWLTASGCFFGAAISCRPHLGMAGLFALAGLAILLAGSRARLTGFAAAFALAGSLVALYNYERFGKPFEFGIRYLLTGPEPIGIKLALANLLPGCYFWLLCPPEFSRVFPWIRLAFRYPFGSVTHAFPHDYFIEPTAGVLYLAPFVAAALFVPFARRSILLWSTLLSSAAVFLFLNATGFTTQRYEVDFLPMALLVALVNLAGWIHRTRGRPRTALRAALIVAILSGAAVNLALAIQGPYGDMLKKQPATYLRIARWFSPTRRVRPMLNPAVDVSFVAEFRPQPDRYREPLLVTGHQPYRYILYAEHLPGGLRFVSVLDEKRIATELPGRDDIRAEIRVRYDPGAGKLTATVNGQQVAVYEAPQLILAPEEITVGENRVKPDWSTERFTGRISGIVTSVRPTARETHPRPQ